MKQDLYNIYNLMDQNNNFDIFKYLSLNPKDKQGKRIHETEQYDNEIIIKLKMPTNSLNVETVYAILKHLNDFALELSKILNMNPGDIGFKLNYIKPGSVIFSFSLLILNYTANTYLIAPFMNGLLGDNKYLNKLEKDSYNFSLLLRTFFIKILSSKNTKNMENVKIQKIKKKFFKKLDSIPELKAVVFLHDGIKKEIKKENIVDYYA